MSTIRKILVANRGEIACRIIRTCRDMGIRSVAVFSDVDKTSRHVSLADESVPLGGSTPGESYLRQEKILHAVKLSRADAVHPGYGFLSENPDFADAVVASGVIFIGPTGDSIRRMGNKTAARHLATSVGVPTVPGTLEPLKSDDEAVECAATIGYPILLKAAAGGGGKGMRIVRQPSDLSAALRSARHEASVAFGDDRVYVEKYVQNPRHVEIQILADVQGHVISLGERECSIQRRHQKVIEESPSTIVDGNMRKAMGDAAVQLAKAGGYSNAGTVEFIVDADKKFYFLEMNTRLQVEHPVTEMVTGIDLVREQILISQGTPLRFQQDQITTQGHAIECRVCSEDPANDFLPSTGRILAVDMPSGPFIRVENGIQAGDVVSVYYDPLLAKLVAWGKDRNQAVERMERALTECAIAGVQTTIPFCRLVLRDPEFLAGRFDTHFVAERFHPRVLEAAAEELSIPAAVAATYLATRMSRRGVEPDDQQGTHGASLWMKQKTDQHS